MIKSDAGVDAVFYFLQPELNAGTNALGFEPLALPVAFFCTERHCSLKSTLSLEY